MKKILKSILTVKQKKLRITCYCVAAVLLCLAMLAPNYTIIFTILTIMGIVSMLPMTRIVYEEDIKKFIDKL